MGKDCSRTIPDYEGAALVEQASRKLALPARLLAVSGGAVVPREPIAMVGERLLDETTVRGLFMGAKSLKRENRVGCIMRALAAISNGYRQISNPYLPRNAGGSIGNAVLKIAESGLSVARLLSSFQDEVVFCLPPVLSLSPGFTFSREDNFDRFTFKTNCWIPELPASQISQVGGQVFFSDTGKTHFYHANDRHRLPNSS